MKILKYHGKHLGRGTTINREVTPEEAINMFDKCLESIR